MTADEYQILRRQYWDMQHACHTVIAREIRAGRIAPARTKICVDCGAKAAGYDHRDYRHPLVVEPVCGSHNRRRGVAEPFRNLIPDRHPPTQVFRSGKMARAGWAKRYRKIQALLAKRTEGSAGVQVVGVTLREYI